MPLADDRFLPVYLRRDKTFVVRPSSAYLRPGRGLYASHAYGVWADHHFLRNEALNGASVNVSPERQPRRLPRRFEIEFPNIPTITDDETGMTWEVPRLMMYCRETPIDPYRNYKEAWATFNDLSLVLFGAEEAFAPLFQVLCHQRRLRHGRLIAAQKKQKPKGRRR
jgi:hypothetical protein